jgi:hypothetical protein
LHAKKTQLAANSLRRSPKIACVVGVNPVAYL